MRVASCRVVGGVLDLGVLGDEAREPRPATHLALGEPAGGGVPLSPEQHVGEREGDDDRDEHEQPATHAYRPEDEEGEGEESEAQERVDDHGHVASVGPAYRGGMRLLVYVVPVALAIFALFDVFRSEESERSGLPRALWAAIVVVLPVLGPVVWIIVSRVRRAEAEGRYSPTPGPSRPWGASGPARPSGGSGTSRGGSGARPPIRPGWSRRPAGPTAPDDDPEFLRDLERQWRREKRGGETPEEPSGDEPRTP